MQLFVEVGRPAHRDRPGWGLPFGSVDGRTASAPATPGTPRSGARWPGIVDDIPVQVVAVLNVELPETRSLEAGSAQNLGERDLLPVGKVLVGQDSGGPTVAAKQQRRARGDAQWILAVRPREDDAGPGQSVEDRCDCETVSGVAGSIETELVAHQQQDIAGAYLRLAPGEGTRNGTEDPAERGVSHGFQKPTSRCAHVFLSGVRL